MTATLTMMLVQEGKIKLTDSIKKFLPDLSKEYGNITIKQLLTHRSGLAQYHYFCYEYVSDLENPIDNDSLVCIMSDNSPENYFKPGRKHNYCNTNYALLAEIISAIEFESFKKVAERKIFKPLGMNSSFVIDMTNDTLPANLVLGNTEYNKEFDLDYLDGIVGDKGIYSNAEDLMKFDIALNTGKLINDSIKELCFKPHNKINQGYNTYGLGWRIRMHPKYGKIVYHTGWWHGNRHIYIKAVEKNTTIIILSNALRGSVYNLNEIVSILFMNDPV